MDQRREGEGMTEFTMRRLRNEIIEECANVAIRWSDDAAEFEDDRAKTMRYTCKNLATALRHLKQ